MIDGTTSAEGRIPYKSEEAPSPIEVTGGKWQEFARSSAKNELIGIYSVEKSADGNATVTKYY